MARTPYYHDPSRKHVEAYQDFSGGLNTTASNDNLSDAELTELKNVDLSDRGSLLRRKGFARKWDGQEGQAQGLFYYHHKYSPYNLIGEEGEFEDELYKESRKSHYLGPWVSFNFKEDYFIEHDTPLGNTNTKGKSVHMIKGTKDDSLYTGISYRGFDIKPGRHYIAVVDYKTDDKALGRISAFDLRGYDDFSTYFKDLPNTNGNTETAYLVFKSESDGYSQVLSLYNFTDPVDITENVSVWYDHARVFEISGEIYSKIDNHPDYTGGEAIAKMFPYTSGILQHRKETHEIQAIGGKFYVNGRHQKVEGDIPIQSTRPMEAVHFNGDLIIASGSGLLVYNGSTIREIEPYAPDTLENLYIGTNAIQSDAERYKNVLADDLAIRTIVFDKRYGVINKPGKITALVKKPTYVDVEYKFDLKRSTAADDTFFTVQDWSQTPEYNWTPEFAGDYEIKVTIRQVDSEGQPVEDTEDAFTIPKYTVKPSGDPGNVPIDGDTIRTCNRILVHWDRLIVYGDEAKEDVIYMSHLNQEDYFPIVNSLQIKTDNHEKITAIVRFRDNLIVFTEGTVQALLGTNPLDYRRVVMNSEIGCIAPRSAMVMTNTVAFLSSEGLALLKSTGFTENRANVDIIDEHVKGLIQKGTGACGMVHDNQYHLVFPETGERIRYYYERGVWAYDQSSKLDFFRMYVHDYKLVGLRLNGEVLEEADRYDDDGEVYDSVVKTKAFDFGVPYSPKKVKELQFTFDDVKQQAKLNTEIILDYDDAQKTTITLAPGQEIYRVPAFGKGNFISARITHSLAEPYSFSGLAFIFKLKHP